MHSDQGSQGLLSPFLQRRRVAAARPFIRGRVLDIGCGNGVVAAHVPSSDYLGVDRSAGALLVARRRFPEHRFVAVLPKPTGDYDTVVALALIEHVPDPGGALSHWSEYLKPGGQVVLTTPHPSYEWAHEAGAKVGMFSHDAAEEHEEMIDRPKMDALISGGPLSLERYRRFLLGVNQLFLLRKT